MTDDDYDALSQKQLASIKRDMRISLEDAAVRATYKVMAELAQPDQEPLAWKLMPREATREMLEAMDECSTEGYDERLYAGHASSVYMAAWDAQQPEQYITDAMKVRQAVAQALLDDVYAEELEQPEAKQSGTISITTPAPIAYLCENATGHKYFRWKKPSSVYKPIPLYTTPPQRTDEEEYLSKAYRLANELRCHLAIAPAPQRTWVGLTDEDCKGMSAGDKVVAMWADRTLKEKNA